MFNRNFRETKESRQSSQSSKLDQPRKKETKTWLKLNNNKQSYEKEIKKHREHMNKQIAGVNKMLKEGSISEDIHERYLKLLEIGYAQQIQETRVKFGFQNC